jgi:hypothetical protein
VRSEEGWVAAWVIEVIRGSPGLQRITSSADQHAALRAACQHFRASTCQRGSCTQSQVLW